MVEIVLFRTLWFCLIFVACLCLCFYELNMKQSSDQGLSKLIRDALPIVIYSEGCAVSMLDNQ